MNLTRYVSSLFLCAIIALPVIVQAGDDEENDEYGLFYFDASVMDFSEGAVNPKACVTMSGEDYVVFDIYQKNHNQCKRKSLGTYKQDIKTFIVSYAKQQQKDAENGNGNGYEVDEGVLEYLECQEYYYNNNMFYLKLGCRDSSGKGFQINAYDDMYCSNKVSQNYNLGIDISSLKVSFDTCKTCITQSNNQYNNNNNNGNNNQEYYYEYDAYPTPLCSALYNYKETCNGSCKRAAKKATSSSRSSSYSGEGFSPLGKFFLWVMSFTAVFFLLASLAQRKKMSKTDAVLEEAAIKSAGVDKKLIPRIFVGVALFICLLILLKRKILTWFFLTAVNVALLGYWIHLKNKSDGKAGGASNDYQMYGNNGGTPA